MTATDFAIPALGGLRVLVVEAEEDAAAALTAVLRLKGFNANCARTFEAALKSLHSTRPHAVVIDPELPDGDGIELIRRSRASAHPAVVVVVSGNTGLGARRAAAAAGANEYILKPSDPSRLVDLIERYCDAAVAG